MDQVSDMRPVGIIGLGVVGQTLAVKLADVGFSVYGVEKNLDTLAQLASRRSDVMEPGLTELLNRHLGHRLHVRPPDGSLLGSVDARTISVGTDYPPEASRPELQNVESAALWLSSLLEPGRLWWRYLTDTWMVEVSTLDLGSTKC